jgi:hypothetical protein
MYDPTGFEFTANFISSFENVFSFCRATFQNLSHGAECVPQCHWPLTIFSDVTARPTVHSERAATVECGAFAEGARE